MFNFRNRKRFGETDTEVRENEAETGEAAESSGLFEEGQATETVQEEAAIQTAQEIQAEPVTGEQQPFGESERAAEDFSAFNMDAFPGFEAPAFEEKEAAEIQEEAQASAFAAVVPPVAEQEAQGSAETSPFIEMEIAQDAGMLSGDAGQTQASGDAESAAAQEFAAPEAPVQEQTPSGGTQQNSAEGVSSSAAQEGAAPSGFNPADYVVNLNYKDKSVFEVNFSELPEEERADFIDNSKNIIRMMALNTNNLINLVMRKNKRIAQYEEIQRLYENMQRDFDNYKRRNADLHTRAQEEGFAKALIAVLPTLDNFDRAVSMIKDKDSLDGVVMIQRQLWASLDKLGVSEIEAVGKDFDPNFHNAVMQVETDDAAQADKVVEVFQKGYCCGDKVLRYAQVKVAKKY